MALKTEHDLISMTWSADQFTGKWRLIKKKKNIKRLFFFVDNIKMLPPQKK